jgi:hypothetical protein
MSVSGAALRGLAALALGFLASRLVAAEATADTGADEEIGDVTRMPAFKVTGERVEDFGFRVSAAYDPKRTRIWPVYTPVVDVLLPNTAASRAGLRPGDRIVTSDGKSTASATFSIRNWHRIQERKWAELAAGKKNVAWTLGVEPAEGYEVRTLVLVVPTPPPHWGGSIWQMPENRKPTAVPEPGPLAERAGLVLDNGIWTVLRTSYLRGFGLPVYREYPYFLCYEWTLQSGAVGHRIYASRYRGTTDVVLEVISRETRWQASPAAPASGPSESLTSPTNVLASESHAFLTSPSGALEKAWQLPQQREIPLDQARAEFQEEMDFWLEKAGKVSPRWPLELIAERSGSTKNLAAVPQNGPLPGIPQTPAGPRAAAFLKLPPASEAQRALLTEALGKIDADADRWAYTEISHPIGDKHEVVVRVDPSKPQAERCILLRMDGKAPTADELKRWRMQDHSAPSPLGELPPFGDIVDMTDIRVFKDEAAAVVLELPLRGNNPAFPAERFQALFRVNKTRRAFEDITIGLREAWRVAGVAKITDAGMEVRFRTLDPSYAPQPVSLKFGGAVRVLLVKFGRTYETVRTEFQRVEPYDESTPVVK